MYAGHRNESCLLLYIGIESLKIGELQKVGGKECEGLVGGRKGGAEGRKEGRKGGRQRKRKRRKEGYCVREAGSELCHQSCVYFCSQ